MKEELDELREIARQMSNRPHEYYDMPSKQLKRLLAEIDALRGELREAFDAARQVELVQSRRPLRSMEYAYKYADFEAWRKEEGGE